MKDAPYIENTERYGYEKPPKVFGICSECEDSIFEGERYADIDGKRYCECCIEDMPLKKLLGMFGAELKEAK